MAVSAGKLLDRQKKVAKRRRAGIVVEADFAEPRTIQQLAEEQRRFVETIDMSGKEYVSLDLPDFEQVMGSLDEIANKRRNGILSSSAWEVLEDS